MSKVTERIKELDGVRAIAIIMVLCWHYFFCQLRPEPGSFLELFREVFATTWAGVDLFFVLSGFLIGGILIDNKQSLNRFSTFYIRRFFRIMPLYYLVVGIYILCVLTGLDKIKWLFVDPLPFWTYLSFTQNFLMAGEKGFGASWLGVTWSLAVEEQFYIVLPMLIYWLPKKPAKILITTAVLAAPFFRWWLSNRGSYIYPFARADSLLMGVLAAYLIRSEFWLQNHFKWQNKMFWLIYALFLGALTITALDPTKGLPLIHFEFALLFGATVLYVYSCKGAASLQWLRSEYLIWVGQRAYAIYLFHEIVSGLLHGLVFKSKPRLLDFSHALVTISALAVTLALAELSMRYLERNMLQLGARRKY